MKEMEREENKGGERKGKKQEEFMGIKLKRGVLVGKRGGNSTPVTTWRIGFAQPDGTLLQDPTFPAITTTTTLSARKLGASLKAANMTIGCSRRHHHREKEKTVDLHAHMAEPPNSPTEQPASTSSLRRHIAASLIQHHRPVGRNGHALQPVSPASCSSSVEVAPYHPAVISASPMDFKGKGKANYSLKTSADLLKLLDRIWSLEEQHRSNSSLVKALKRELDHSRAQIKELLREKKKDRREIEAVQSVRDELEIERKLRKHSESLHRKLARELSEVKSSLMNPMKEVERERKARILLEKLCDEFAKGIRGYEEEVRSLKHSPHNKDRIARESPDRLILHISEAWLDERMQMKLAEARCDPAEKNTIVEKLRYDIEAFLQAKQPVCSGNNDELSSKKGKESSKRGHSLESFHLNEAVSAPPLNVDYEEDSINNGLKNFELKRDPSGKRRNGCSKQLDDNGHVLNTLTKNRSLPRKDGKIHHKRHPEDSLDQAACASASSIKPQRVSRITTPEHEVSESSRNGPEVVKENSLKARLLEAKLESQQSRPKSSKAPSR